jgi:hypothetical protein
MKLLNNVRLLIIVLLVLASALAIMSPLLSPFFTSSGGVFVSSVDQNAKCVGVAVGSKVTQVGGRYVRSVNDFAEAVANIKMNDFVTVLADSTPGNCIVLADKNPGFGVSSKKASAGVEFGIELGGGTTYSYNITASQPQSPGQTQTNIESVMKLVRKRAELFGFQDTTITSSDSMLKITTTSPKDVSTLFFPGKIEARMYENVKIQNNEGSFFVGDKKFNFTLSNGTMMFLGKEYSPSSTTVFTLEGITFHYINSTGTNAAIEAVAFDNSDIITALLSQSTMTTQTNSQQAKIYQYQIPVTITQNASDKFQIIAQKMPTTLSGSRIVLDGFLVYYLDGREISKLSVPIEFIKSPILTVAITGFAATNNQAKEDKLKIVASLQGGSLDSQITLVNKETVLPTMKNSALVILTASLVVMFVLTVGTSVFRYKNYKAGLISFVLILSGLFIALGIFNFELLLSGLNFIINIKAIYALSLAGMLTGIHFILSSERINKTRNVYLRIGYKKIMSLQSFVYVFSIIIAILSVGLYERNFGILMFFTIVIDWILINGSREKLMKKM